MMDDFYVMVCNNIQFKLGDEESFGYGFFFLRKRYRLMDIEVGIIVEESNDEFCVKLKLIQEMNVLIVEDELYIVLFLQEIIEQDLDFIVLEK